MNMEKFINLDIFQYKYYIEQQSKPELIMFLFQTQPYLGYRKCLW